MLGDFDVTPLDGNTEIEDVVRAYGAASRYVKSMGMMVPPFTGDDAGVVHGRLQIDTSPEMPTESSFVVFSELQKPTFAEDRDHSDKCVDPVGMLVLDSVDEDELHPYRPSEFLREDVNAVITITRGSRRQNGYKDNDPDKRVPCLILTRWVLLTLRPDQKGMHPQVPWTSCSKPALTWATRCFTPSRKLRLVRNLLKLAEFANPGDWDVHAHQPLAALRMSPANGGRYR